MAGAMRIEGLGYIGFDATDLPAWARFAEELLGFAPAAGAAAAGGAGGLGATNGAGADALFYRLDERRWRVAVHRAARPGLAYIGWELADARALASASEHLAACGVTVDRSVAPQTRGVAGLIGFVDPAGNRHELFHGAATDPTPFVSPAGVSGFVTANGMGHVLCVVPDAAAAEAWSTRVLGLRTTDRMDMGLGKRAVFMRTNARHHALAVTDVLPDPCFHHLMVEAKTLEDVGVAWDRAQKQKADVMMTIGQHANDPMLSFYLTSPSGCGIEFGAGGTLVDDARWQIRDVGPDELWGHRGPTMDAIESGGGRA